MLQMVIVFPSVPSMGGLTCCARAIQRVYASRIPHVLKSQCALQERHTVCTAPNSMRAGVDVFNALDCRGKSIASHVNMLVEQGRPLASRFDPR